MADGVGFEPTRSRPLPVFKTGAFNRSATHPSEITLFLQICWRQMTVWHPNFSRAVFVVEFQL